MTRSLTVVLTIVGDLIAVLFRSRAAMIAENLFLRLSSAKKRSDLSLVLRRSYKLL